MYTHTTPPLTQWLLWESLKWVQTYLRTAVWLLPVGTIYSTIYIYISVGVGVGVGVGVENKQGNVNAGSKGGL